MPRMLRLRDGRALTWQEWGDPRGVPVVHLHGTPGSRLERYPDAAQTAALGVRFLTFDRPGYGGSDLAPGRDLLTVAADVAQLADALGLDRFALHGLSGGAPHALGCAWTLGERVVAVAVVAGLGPLDRPGALDGMAPSNAAALRVAATEPDRLAQVLAGTADDPLPGIEAAALESVPGLGRMLLQQFREVTRQGDAGMVADQLALSRPWGFPVEEVTAPVDWWHGTADPFVPLHHAEHVTGLLPAARLHRCAGEGHLAMFGRQREVLGHLAAALAGT